MAHNQYYFFGDDNSSAVGEALFRQTLREVDEQFYATFPEARLAAEREGRLCFPSTTTFGFAFYQEPGNPGNYIYTAPATDCGSTLHYSYLHNTQITDQPSSNVPPLAWATPSPTATTSTTTTQAGPLEQQQQQQQQDMSSRSYSDTTPSPVAPVQPYQEPLYQRPSLSDAQSPPESNPGEQPNPVTRHAAHRDRRSQSRPYPRPRTKDDIENPVETSARPAHRPGQHLPSPNPSQTPTWSPGRSSPPQIDSPPNARPAIPLSPLPTKRQMEKKPPLACLFCRGRKIACGAPLPGSPDRTCNQCQRRCLQCEYPSESRRGMRKKKATKDSTDTTNEPTQSTSATPPTFPGEGTLEP